MGRNTGVKGGKHYKGETGFDLSAGAEFRITKNFNLWLQLNNIFNNKYERWHQYECLGLIFWEGLLIRLINSKIMCKYAN